MSRPTVGGPLDRVVAAARELFIANGITGTGVEDIAAVAEVSRSTLYRYFSSRDAIVVEVMAREYEHLVAESAAVIAGHEDFATQVVELVVHYARMVRTHPLAERILRPDPNSPSLAKLIVSERFMGAMRGALDPFFDRARQRGELRDDIDNDDVRLWLLQVFTGLLTSGFVDQRSPDELRDWVGRLVIPSLAGTDTIPNAKRAGQTEVFSALARVENQLALLTSQIRGQRAGVDERTDRNDVGLLH